MSTNCGPFWSIWLLISIKDVKFQPISTHFDQFNFQFRPKMSHFIKFWPILTNITSRFNQKMSHFYQFNNHCLPFVYLFPVKLKVNVKFGRWWNRFRGTGGEVVHLSSAIAKAFNESNHPLNGRYSPVDKEAKVVRHCSAQFHLPLKDSLRILGWIGRDSWFWCSSFHFDPLASLWDLPRDFFPFCFVGL